MTVGPSAPRIQVSRYSRIMRPTRALALSFLALCSCSSAPPQQHEVTAPGDLLTTDGRLAEPGWARRQLLRYDASRVHDASRLRRWDFFAIQSDAAAVNLSLTDLGFVRLASIGLVDLATGAQVSTSALASTGDAFTLADTLEGESSLTAAGATTPSLRFSTTADTTTVDIAIPQTLLGEAASGTFTIHRRPQSDYLSLATPFADDPTDFFYEQKLPGLSADGSVAIGAHARSFAAAATTAVEDWGRGQWPSKVTWRWASAAGTASDGTRVALNLGEGFGDARAGTENLVVVGDRAAKLAAVAWSHDAADLTRDWTFRSPDGRVDLVLHPVAPEESKLDLGPRYEHLHKVYGQLTGTLALEDGRTLKLDGGDVAGAAEEMELSW